MAVEFTNSRMKGESGGHIFKAYKYAYEIEYPPFDPNNFKVEIYDEDDKPHEVLVVADGVGGCVSDRFLVESWRVTSDNSVLCLRFKHEVTGWMKISYDYMTEEV